MNWMTWEELWVIYCKSAVASFSYIQNGGILIIFLWNSLKILKWSGSSQILNCLIDTIFKKTKVKEGLQFGGKRKSEALLVKDLEIRWRPSLKSMNSPMLKTNQDIKKLPRQIYRKLSKVPFKHFNLKKNLIEFYNHPFKDLSPIC